VTYIKPETVSNQSSLIKAILNQGFEAAQRQNWLELSHQLQLLPQSNIQPKKLWLLKGSDWQKAFDLACKMLVQADFQHQWSITKLFPRLGVKIVTPLGTLLLDETLEPEVRWFICQILGDFPNPEVVLVLVQLLQQTTDSELVSIASKTLIKIGNQPKTIGSQQAIDALVNLLSQSKYRQLAVESLAYIRTAETIAPLLNIATDRDPELRTIAIEALSSFHDRRIPPILLNALQDKASSVRKAAAIALGFRPDLCQELNLVAHLQPLLKDLNLEVCRYAAVSLCRMRQESATSALYEVFQTDHTPIELKSELVKALGWSETSSAIDYLQQALTQGNELITQEIITILGRITTPELKSQSARVLADFWQHNQLCSPQTRQILATSLGELGDQEASTRRYSGRSILEQLALDRDRKVKLHALAALKKLSSSGN
jgi:HEAT repeat protein